MKRIMIGTLLVVVIVGMASFAVLSASENGNTPHEVTNTMFEARSRQGKDAFTRTFCESQLASLVYTSTFQSSTAPTLTANISGDKAVIIAGFAASGTLDWEVHLEKQGKNWCIVELESIPE